MIYNLCPIQFFPDHYHALTFYKICNYTAHGLASSSISADTDQMEKVLNNKSTIYLLCIIENHFGRFPKPFVALNFQTCFHGL